jgi:hypothetical protein
VFAQGAKARGWKEARIRMRAGSIGQDDDQRRTPPIAEFGDAAAAAEAFIIGVRREYGDRAIREGFREREDGKGSHLLKCLGRGDHGGAYRFWTI